MPGVAAGGPAFRRYYEACIERWSQSRYALDKRFVHLTLLLDRGEEAQGPRWSAQARKFRDLREVLADVPDPALVLLGPPGSGKSTLLRHFELDNARTALAAGAAAADPTRAPVTFFIALNGYGTRGADPPPRPLDWLCERWAAENPDWPPLDTLLRQRRVTLLLDALNEMPQAGPEPLRCWKAFLADLTRRHPGNRAIFSCRSLDYSATLSSKDLPVPQVRIEALSDDQIREFLALYCPDHHAALWGNLAGSPQLEVLRSPYFLKLLVAQTTAGEIPEGRAALFGGFARQALQREIEADHPLFQPGALLSERDRQRFGQPQTWKTPHELPRQGILFAKLSHLAFQMQARRQPGEASQVRIDHQDALDLLAHDRAEDVLKAGEALGVLEEDLGRDEVLYVHQLLQEYFAARWLAAHPDPRWVQVEWRADRVSPSLAETLAGLADSDPLPPLPGTGWEETAVLAAAMADRPDAFVADLMAAHLALAGRCAAQPDVSVSDALKDRIRQALLQRTQDPAADLRSRIAAGLALGELGDPRWQRGRGPDGDYLLPPLIAIPGGTYSIGSDEGLYEDEAPVHVVDLQPFQLGQFPVTHAEYALFIKAGGYENERWWNTDTARAWRRGDSTAEGAKQQWRENRQTLRTNFDNIRNLHRQGRITSQQADDWERIARMDDDEFEALLEQWYPPGRQTQPAYWNDEAFNNPAQPVVGICWFEARAYCAWLSAQTGQSFRLPTEAEREAAARGAAGRRYAYGDAFDASRCNAFETHVRRTTPVGVFPGGETPDGLIDMTGNTWDWTGSLDQPYPYLAADGREDPAGDARRVVRGGAWFFLQSVARAASRYFSAPDYRLFSLGFRLARASPIRDTGH
ncbi:MAG: SUMF1/EgtB/PvdO family nonheme iron enzyme [Candidatus Contendobacter sp.]|nr:SUMF1/EgtB/PvdO family nonheme iron enzyme [Candidatus Contendobacter sp.]